MKSRIITSIALTLLFGIGILMTGQSEAKGASNRMESLLKAKENKPEKSAVKTFHRVLLFKWQENSSMGDRKEILRLFTGLPEKVEGMSGCDACLLTKSKEGFETVVELRFSSIDAVEAYEEHPDHKKVQELGPKVVAAFSMYEYWK